MLNPFWSVYGNRNSTITTPGNWRGSYTPPSYAYGNQGWRGVSFTNFQARYNTYGGLAQGWSSFLGGSHNTFGGGQHYRQPETMRVNPSRNNPSALWSQTHTSPSPYAGGPRPGGAWGAAMCDCSCPTTQPPQPPTYGGQQPPQPQMQERGGVLGGGPVISGLPPQQNHAQQGGAGGIVGTLNNVLDRDGDGNALNDLIGMFSGRR